MAGGQFWQAVGAGARQTAQDLAAYGQQRQAETDRASAEEEKQLRLKMLLDDYVEKKMAAEEARREKQRQAKKREKFAGYVTENPDASTQEIARQGLQTEQLGADDFLRYQPKPAEPKAYAPTTQKEALEFHQEKERISSQFRPGPRPSDGDRARAERAAAARRAIPAIWAEIERNWKGPPADAADPMAAQEDWQRRMTQLRQQLNQHEVAAGMQATPFPIDRPEASPSYSLYKQGGPAPAAGPGPAPMAPPQDQDGAALAWLQANPGHPAAAAIQERLRARGKL